MPAQNRHNEHGDQNRARSQFARHFATRLHSAYLLIIKTITGVESTAVRSRYALLLLYRLMFLYFLQRAGLLEYDQDYMQNHLQQARLSEGNVFYSTTLRPLFQARLSSLSSPLTSLFIPYALDESYPEINLPDETFAFIFAIFDQYQWQIHERAGETGWAIVPEMLSILFEEAISQKATGTYYTPADVASYIARNTILPALFQRVEQRLPGTARLLWRQLQAEPERYMFPAMLQGCAFPLPPEIEAGCTNCDQRHYWQAGSSAPYTLTGEIWRETVARRLYLNEMREQIRLDRPDLLQRMVTWNLDHTQLALDMLSQCVQPEVLLTFYHSLCDLTILDPTCGSGAFLFAALAQLEPIYLACALRFKALITQGKLSSFTKIDTLRACEEASSRLESQEKIVSWIIQHNLYGVDLLEEAVEICRQRLFLNMLATITDPGQVQLPADLGKHIQPGNSLLGSIDGTSGSVWKSHGTEQAFNWQERFPEVMQHGGFSIVLGNPPYMEYGWKRQGYYLDGYTTLETGNLYALTIERGTRLLAPGGRFGMIVPASATCTDGYRSLQDLLLSQAELHIASFSDQRGRLFSIPHPRLCIILYEKTASEKPLPARVFSTPYIKVGRTARKHLFESLRYTEVTQQVRPGIIPRYSSPLEYSIQARLAREQRRLGDFFCTPGTYPLYYTRKLSWFVQVTPFIPLVQNMQGQVLQPSELKCLRFTSLIHAQLAFAALNSNLFYWIVTTGSDCRNLNKREIQSFPLDLDRIDPWLQEALSQVAQRLSEDLQAHSVSRLMHFQGRAPLLLQCMHPARSKKLIDKIDALLAEHYGFSPEELDFLVHYDYQYRIGQREDPTAFN